MFNEIAWSAWRVHLKLRWKWCELFSLHCCGFLLSRVGTVVLADGQTHAQTTYRNAFRSHMRTLPAVNWSRCISQLRVHKCDWSQHLYWNCNRLLIHLQNSINDSYLHSQINLMQNWDTGKNVLFHHYRNTQQYKMDRRCELLYIYIYIYASTKYCLWFVIFCWWYWLSIIKVDDLS